MTVKASCSGDPPATYSTALVPDTTTFIQIDFGFEWASTNAPTKMPVLCIRYYLAHTILTFPCDTTGKSQIIGRFAPSLLGTTKMSRSFWNTSPCRTSCTCIHHTPTRPTPLLMKYLLGTRAPSADRYLLSTWSEEYVLMLKRMKSIRAAG